MPVAAPLPHTPVGIREVNKHYRESMLSRLMNTITQALGTPIKFPEGYKPSLKSGGMIRYNGSPKFSDLENWLAAVVYHYALMKLGGDNFNVDRIRVLSLMEFLEGDAQTWYTTHVLNSRCATNWWTFCNVITGLYYRYIFPSSMQDTRENFRKVKYTPTLGVQGFYDALLEHAQNMAVYPDSHTILEEFMGGLPQTMIS
jgi:hypothetical protein